MVAVAKKSVAAKCEPSTTAQAEPPVKTRRPKSAGKIASGNRLANHAGASAWRTACVELGYLLPGVSKKLPKKGTADYAKLKHLHTDKTRADPFNR